MRTLSDTLARLAALRANPVQGTSDDDRLTDLGHFGSNPGALGAKLYIPSSAKPPVALVVILHGCTQTAAGYDAASGWSRLAEDYGFAVLYAEQSRANNTNLCFNWFVSGDIERGQGEAASIHQMITKVAVGHAIDRRRVFITGLSAGGAMANVMLATYPDIFAGGAIIAGLPYGTATSVPQAFDRMRGHGLPAGDELQARLRSASSHKGPWPTISVWHGTRDNTVVDANARAIVEQWRGVHDIVENKGRIEKTGAYSREIWTDPSGREVIDFYSISGMAHGTPIDTASGYGSPAPFMLDTGVSSSELIARSWGLTPSFEKRASSAREMKVAAGQPPRAGDQTGGVGSGIQQVIENALRSAGLMR